MTKLTTKEQELSIALDILDINWDSMDITPAALLATEHLPPFVRSAAFRELRDKLFDMYDAEVMYGATNVRSRVR